VTAWAVAAVLASAPAEHPPTVVPPRDFVEYWSAARVHAQGGDPYDGGQLLPYQREASGDPDKSQAVMLWTPPWTLPLYLPFGLLDPRTGHLLWLVAQAAAVAVSAGLLWRVYDGPSEAGALGRRAWALAPLAAVGFGPVWWLMAFGQNTGFVLLGLAGFLYLRTRGYPVAAGAAAALTAVKPHLLALFGLALLLDAAATRDGRRALLGGVAALLVLSAVALIPNPDVFREFAAALARPGSDESPNMAAWKEPLTTYWLRVWLSPGSFWVQFVPVAAACGLLVPYWWARRRTWDWAAEAPRLVFASILLAPYGAWVFDLVVLLVPVMKAFAGIARWDRPVPVTASSSSYLLVSLATILAPAVVESRLGWEHGLHHFIWVAPAVFIWYLAVAGRPPAAVSPPAEAPS
jgi:hypothetical protein